MIRRSLTPAETVAEWRQQLGPKPSNRDLFTAWDQCLKWLDDHHVQFDDGKVFDFMHEVRGMLEFDEDDDVGSMLYDYMSMASL